MSKSKDNHIKTNAMRILDKEKIPYKVNYYNCEEFIDGVHIADMLSQPYEISFKTLVLQGKSGEHYVFVLPVDKEIDMKKAAKAAGEKSVSMVHVKDIKALTGYIRGGCTAIGMKKQFACFVHESVLKHEEIIVSGGALGVQLMLSPQNLLEAAKASVADIIFEN